MENKIKFMRLALKQALKGEQIDEVPIGAVIVKDNKVISRAFNKIEKKQVSTCHAEILAIEKACKKLNSWRLDNCDIYITLEPCPMCAGAIANSRIRKVYFGAYESKSGCAISLYPVLEKNGLNHTTEYEGGILEAECSSLIKNYFKKKREKQKSID